MGADIYLTSVTDKRRAEKKDILEAADQSRHSRATFIEAYDYVYQDDAYYRDPYNESNLMWLYQLSYWADIGDWLDEEGQLPIDKAKEWLAKVEAGDVAKLVATALENGKHNTANGLHANDPGYRKPSLSGFEESPAELVAYFEKKRENLIKLLKRSIELDEPLYCSF